MKMKMKSIFLLTTLWSSAFAACDPETVVPVSDGLSKLTVTGFADPIINYFSAISGMVSYISQISFAVSTVLLRRQYFVVKGRLT